MRVPIITWEHYWTTVRKRSTTFKKRSGSTPSMPMHSSILPIWNSKFSDVPFSLSLSLLMLFSFPLHCIYSYVIYFVCESVSSHFLYSSFTYWFQPLSMHGTPRKTHPNHFIAVHYDTLENYKNPLSQLTPTPFIFPLSCVLSSSPLALIYSFKPFTPCLPVPLCSHL